MPGKNQKAKFFFSFIVILCGIFLTSCDDEKKQALADAAAAKMELTQVKADLIKALAERDGLNVEISKLHDEISHLQSELEDYQQGREEFEELSKEKDAAQAKTKSSEEIIAKMTAMLKEYASKNKELTETIQTQQAKIAELQSQITEKSNSPD